MMTGLYVVEWRGEATPPSFPRRRERCHTPAILNNGAVSVVDAVPLLKICQRKHFLYLPNASNITRVIFFFHLSFLSAVIKEAYLSTFSCE